MRKIQKKKKASLLVRSCLAYGLAGFTVPTLWGLLASPFGSWAGLIAGLLIIAPVWFIVHYKKLIPHEVNAITVDMGGAIALAVFVRDSLRHGFSGSLQAIPTLMLVIIGASLAGFSAVKIEQFLERRAKNK